MFRLEYKCKTYLQLGILEGMMTKPKVVEPDVEVLEPHLVRVSKDGCEMTIRALPKGGLDVDGEVVPSTFFHRVRQPLRGMMLSAAGRKFAQMRRQAAKVPA